MRLINRNYQPQTGGRSDNVDMKSVHVLTIHTSVDLFCYFSEETEQFFSVGLCYESKPSFSIAFKTNTLYACRSLKAEVNYVFYDVCVPQKGNWCQTGWLTSHLMI